MMNPAYGDKPSASSRDSSSYPSVCSSKPSLSYNKVSEQSDGMIKDSDEEVKDTFTMKTHKNPGASTVDSNLSTFALPSGQEATVTETTAKAPTINSKKLRNMPKAHLKARPPPLIILKEQG
ncbi:hypothetical protein EVAR_92819_1 [Eumeta japonica]|uniref:Uncharacterized protein n=1 Tax=Eumeta variegata TaxID=151549 RepID=A0A4C1TD02_EUMVA|nr:hypothetical protein EVAR_92819_1 [Eumeta japonica]